MDLSTKTELMAVKQDICIIQDDLFSCFDKLEEMESVFKIVTAIQIVQSIIIIILSAFVLWGVL